MAALFDEVLRVVGHWKPARHRDWHERDYRDDLAVHLKATLELDANVEKSRWLTDRRRRPDLFITSTGAMTVADADGGETIAIEMKLDLATAAEMNRLTKQVRDILARPEPPIRRLLVVAVGDTDEGLLEKLGELETGHRRPLEARSAGQVVVSRRLRVITTPLGRRRRPRRKSPEPRKA